MCSARHLYLSGCISALLHCGVNIKKDDLPSAHKRCSQRKAMLSRQLLLLNAHKRCPSSDVLWNVFAQTTERTDVYMLPGRSACVDGDAEMPFAIITTKNKCAPARPSRPTRLLFMDPHLKTLRSNNWLPQDGKEKCRICAIRSVQRVFLAKETWHLRLKIATQSLH